MLKVLSSLFVALLLSACGLHKDPSSSSDHNQEQFSEEQTNDQTTSGMTSEQSIKKSSILDSLNDGGYIIYFRHATTEKDYADQADPLMSLQDCNSQRKLSIQGINESHKIGLAFASNGIPVDQIIVSEYCRSWKTANFAFGEWTQKDSRLNFLPYENYTEDHVALMKRNVMPLLTHPPRPGTNTIIIGHDDIFEAATGIYPEPQGIAYILRPDGKNNFKIITNVLPSEWASL